MKPIPEGTIVSARYRVERELGRGGMGAVYQVEHVHTGAKLAMKVLLGQASADSNALARFKREARASARINSEHVVTILDADVAPELDGAPFIVMELLDGCDLERLVASRGKLPPAQVVALLVQAARALDKSHALGIVHRDLKPENLFLHRREDGSEMLKVVDFGISKMLDPQAGAGAIAVTSSGTMMGTPLFMSPEQAKGLVAEVGPATDVWAMGLVTVRLLTADHYWTARSIAELMVQVLQETMAPPSQRWDWLPPAFDAWFARSCARVVDDRFKTVGAQIAALAEALGLPAEIARSPSVAPPDPLLPEVDAISPYAETIDSHDTPGSRARTASEASRSVGPQSDTARPAGSRVPWAVGATVVVLGAAALVVRTLGSDGAPASVVADGASTVDVGAIAVTTATASAIADASIDVIDDASAHPDAAPHAPSSVATVAAPHPSIAAPKTSASVAPAPAPSASAKGYAPTTL